MSSYLMDEHTVKYEALVNVNMLVDEINCMLMCKLDNNTSL